MRRQLVAIAIALVLAAAACGGDDDGDSSATTAGDGTTTTAAQPDPTDAPADLPTQAELAAQYKIPEFANLTVIAFQEGLADGAVAVHYGGKGARKDVLDALTAKGWFTAVTSGELGAGPTGEVRLVQTDADFEFFATLMLFPEGFEPSMDPDVLRDLIEDLAPPELLDAVPDYINEMGLTREYLIFALYPAGEATAAN